MATRTKDPAASATVDFFVADDVRQETDGKVTLVGMFPDRVVVMQTPADVPEPSKTHPLLIDSLSFLINVRDVVGAHAVQVVIGDGPTDVGMFSGSARNIDFPATGDGVNLIFKLRPLIVQSYGVKKVRVTVDGVEHARTFEVRQRSAKTRTPTRPVKKAHPVLVRKAARPKAGA